jgi:hypothetical protein
VHDPLAARMLQGRGSLIPSLGRIGIGPSFSDFCATKEEKRRRFVTCSQDWFVPGTESGCLGTVTTSLELSLLCS